MPSAAAVVVSAAALGTPTQPSGLPAAVAAGPPAAAAADVAAAAVDVAAAVAAARRRHTMLTVQHTQTAGTASTAAAVAAAAATMPTMTSRHDQRNSFVSIMSKASLIVCVLTIKQGKWNVQMYVFTNNTKQAVMHMPAQSAHNEAAGWRISMRNHLTPAKINGQATAAINQPLSQTCKLCKLVCWWPVALTAHASCAGE